MKGVQLYLYRIFSFDNIRATIREPLTLTGLRLVLQSRESDELIQAQRQLLPLSLRTRLH